MSREYNEVNPEVLDRLARQFSPILRFHEDERFFPLLAEAWLTTTTNGVWPEDPTPEVARLGQPVTDSFRRGAALCSTPDDFPNLAVIAGPPLGGDRPLDLDADASDPYSIASSLVSRLGGKAFVDIGGWDPTSNFTRGDADFLTALCSELGGAVNRSVDWDPPDRFDVQPWQWVAQSVNPTMYCEIAWAGAAPRLSQQGGLGDFPNNDYELDTFISFTYYLLYGARVPPPGDNNARLSEGQWEAVTLFFPARVDDSEPLVGQAYISNQPTHVVVSQGYDRTADVHRTEVREYQGVELLNGHPVVYVARGTHRNYFAPVTGSTWEPGKHPLPGDSSAHDNEKGTWAGVDGFLVTAGVLLGVAVVLAIGAAILIAAGAVIAAAIAIAAAVLLIIVAIVLFIAWLISLFGEDSDDSGGDPVSYGNEPDDASDQGPQAGGDGSEPPANPPTGSGGGSTGGGPGGGGPAGGSVGLPNSGSPTGRNTVSPDIRIVERLLRADAGGAVGEYTSYPTDRTMENPPWWDYRGRWGVQIKTVVDGTWESGWHRVDDHGRGWSYWAAQRLNTKLNDGRPQS